MSPRLAPCRLICLNWAQARRPPTFLISSRKTSTRFWPTAPEPQRAGACGADGKPRTRNTGTGGVALAEDTRVLRLTQCLGFKNTLLRDDRLVRLGGRRCRRARGRARAPCAALSIEQPCARQADQVLASVAPSLPARPARTTRLRPFDLAR